MPIFYCRKKKHTKQQKNKCMQFRTIKTLSVLACLTAISGMNLVSVHAQDTTNANLTVTASALTMYAGDTTDNNDLCATGDTATYNYIKDDGTTASVTCSIAERSVSLSSISVLSTRQNTTTTVNDVLCEDLTGSISNTYSVSATIGNLVNQGSGNSINLGANPDGATVETASDSDAPVSTDAGKIFATYTPGAAVQAIAPEAARTTASVNFTAGAKATVVSTSTSIGVYSTSAATLARRFDSDGNALKYRIPAFPSANSYVGGVTYTCTAS